MLIPNAVWVAVRPVVLFGWVVAALRLLLDWCASTRPSLQPLTMFVGVYALMPLGIAVATWKGRFDGFRWRRLALAMWLVALLCWGLPNAVAYSAGQFGGWDFGRFVGTGEEARTAPIQDGTALKLLAGAGVGLMTHLLGTVWCVVWASALRGLRHLLTRRKA